MLLTEVKEQPMAWQINYGNVKEWGILYLLLSCISLIHWHFM